MSVPSRNFKWDDLSSKIRGNIINKMDAKTRCKFVQCSKECEEQAKSSNNYLYGIKIFETKEEKKKMLVIKLEKDEEDSDYCLDFLKVRGEEKMTVLMYRKYMRQDSTDQGGVKKWMKLVHENPEVLRRKYFMEYLETYKNSIKMLRILDKDFAINDFNINGLKKLEILDFGASYPRLEIEQLNAFVDFEKLMNLKIVMMGTATLSFEQIIQFRGDVLTVASQDFIQETFEKYFKMLENDEVPYTSLVVHRLNESDLDYGKIIEGLLNVSGFRNDNGVYCNFNFASKTGKQFGVIISKSVFAITTQHLNI